MMIIRLVVGVLMTVVGLGIAGHRLWTLYKIGKSGQPVEPGRIGKGSAIAGAELKEVLGQRKLFQWTGPGLAHAFVFWGFLILLLTIWEAFGALFWEHFEIPLVGRFPVLGFIEDLAAVMCVAAIIYFTVVRMKQAPKEKGRRSRFFGSHLGPAWFTLFMIFNVVWTLLFTRAAQINAQGVNEPGAEHMQFLRGAFASQGIAMLFAPLGHLANEILETVFLLLSLAILLGFFVFVTYSKHLHIMLSLPNVAFARRPRALGALLPVYDHGKPVDFMDPGEDDMMGVGKVEDFTWKGLLDFGTCTECGRCQSQCPAWNTDKPLSPKLLIMELRDHTLAKAPYLLAAEDARGGLDEAAKAEAERPLVGGSDVNGVIDPDVLWSCTTCGACVQQCPVDIEHIDHIVDMRRHQVMMEGDFPAEAEVMLRNLEHAGDPWGSGARHRTEWIEDMDFDVRVFGEDGEEKIPDDVDYLFWVGCAGALDDKAKETTKAVASLLHTAGVEFMVLGDAEACTGDPARRMGHEFLFQMLAQQNVEILNEAGAKRVITTCAHCFNALANEYPQVGGKYEVFHHTQILAALVREGKLTPTEPVDKNITYHDPCYLGRHNRMFTPPRELLESVPGVKLTEMQRTKERSFCCGAGGARMWMDENIGQRINNNRTDEALALKPDLVTAACPYCITMLGDGVSQRQLEGTAPESVKVTDVAEVLLASVRTAPANEAPANESINETTNDE